MDYREKALHGDEGLPVAIYDITPESNRYNMNMHWHPEHEIIFVRCGRLILRLDDEEYSLGAGDVAFASGGVIHSAVPYECSYTCILVNLPLMMKRADSCMSIVEGIEVDEIKINRIILGDRDISDICLSILYLYREREENFGYHFLMKGLIFTLFGKIFEKGFYSEGNSGRSNDFAFRIKMKSVIEYIEKKYSEPIRLEELSRLCGMTRNHFCRAFKSLAGISPFEYVTQRRLAMSRYMLVSGDVPITEVALECGFSDASYFIKCFRRAYGITPAKFRKNAE